MTANSALAVALRKKFPGADGKKNLMRKLGITMDDLLRPSTGGSGQNKDPVKALRDDVEALLGKLGPALGEHGVKAVLEVLNAHSDPGELPDDDEYAKRAGELAGDDENVEKFRALLRKAGMSDADIETALEMAKTGATDRLPVPAAGHGGFGGYGHGTKVVGDERKCAAYDRMFGSEVIVGIEYGPDRSRGRSVAWPSSLDDYNKRFGGEHIGTNG